MRSILGAVLLGLTACGGESPPEPPAGGPDQTVAAPVAPETSAPAPADEATVDASSAPDGSDAAETSGPEPDQDTPSAANAPRAADATATPAAAATAPVDGPQTDGDDTPTDDAAADGDDAPTEDAAEGDADATDDAPEPRGPVTYTLDSGQSFLAVLIRYDRGALIAGHDHGAQAMRFTGSVTWDPDDLSACDIAISFPVTALAIDPPGLREKMGLKGSTSAGDISKIEKNMLGKHQLESSRFPKITFQSTRCAAAGAKVSVQGTLGMHGVSRSVTANMTITENGEVFRGVGGFAIKGSSWGIDPYTAALGALKNDDALAFTIDVAGIAR